MTIPKISELVKDNIVTFQHYRAGFLYYSIAYNDKASGMHDYIFPVPISDCGEATFNKQEKAIMLMRYIRKAIDEGTFVLMNNRTY